MSNSTAGSASGGAQAAQAGQAAQPGDRIADHDLPLPDLAIEERKDFVLENGVVQLIASRSASSRSLAFPQRSICQVTGARDLQPERVGPDGMLYSFSTIHVSSTRPTPYTLGYVDFPSGLRVLAHVRTHDLSALACDTPVRLAADADSWWVEPLAEGAQP